MSRLPIISCQSAYDPVFAVRFSCQLAQNLPFVQASKLLEVAMSLFKENAEILRGMEDEGSDLTKSCRVDFAHIFPDRAAAEAFAVSASKDGFETTLEEADQDQDPWDVTASRAMVPSAENITLVEERLDGLAREQGGMSDGWGFMRV